MVEERRETFLAFIFLILLVSIVNVLELGLEEIADVMVMLKQFQLYFNISSDEIKEVMKSKVARQVERISKEAK